MVFGKLFSPGANKTKEESHSSQSGKSMGLQARTEFDDPKSKNPKRRLSSNKSENGRKNRDIQVQIFKKIMMKLKAYKATMMKTRYQMKNLVQNSGGGGGGGGEGNGVGKSNDGIFAKVDYFSEENM